MAEIVQAQTLYKSDSPERAVEEGNTTEDFYSKADYRQLAISRESNAEGIPGFSFRV